MRFWLLIGSVAAAACSTKVVEQVGPVGAPAAVAAKFMQAVTDSNVAQLGELWGTSSGPAATTGKPANWAQRVSVIHAYLKGGTHRIVGEDPGVARADRRRIIVEISREGCVKNVPFTMVVTKQGSWIVNAIDLNAAGVPGRPCGSPGTPPPSRGFTR
ncbi:MAG: hypothetical protein FJ206_07995 [Gemmatimonadetes bacterium]|nr:hypothetical protein [Gemmatimonadota bacterium]